VTLRQVGTYTVTYNVNDSTGNAAEQKTRTVNVVDTTAPAAPTEVTPVPTPTNDNTPDYTFHSDENGTIIYSGSCGNGSLTTAIDGNNTITFGSSTVLADGNYSDCTIAIKDDANNTSDALHVSDFIIDVTKPVITLEGNETVEVEKGDVYTDAGATASDNIDGDITATVPPVITLKGKSPVSVIKGTTYTDAGATAYDNVDGDITEKIVIHNPVNTSKVGTYTVTYNVEDTAGNKATEVQRTVNVVNPAPPADTRSSPLRERTRKPSS